jgi:hypothetical protein
MFLDRIVVQRTKNDGSPSLRPNVWLEFNCDGCGKVYRKKPSESVSAIRSKSGLTFCSNYCKFESHKKNQPLHERVKDTCLAKYGTTCVATLESVKAKSKATHVERYGVENSMQLTHFKDKRRATNVARHGAPETFQSADACQKREATWRRKYGQGSPPATVEAAKRSIELQPIKWSSKAEIRFRDALRERFGEVKHQKWCGGWPIDFYIPSIDSYVQFDGVYWHGLDRPIEIIRASKKPRDQKIVTKWETDRKQNEWFAAQGIRLVRVVDGYEDINDVLSQLECKPKRECDK